MSVSILVMLMPILLMGPVLLHDVCKTSYETQRTLVAVDNAGILAGRNLRMMLQNLNRANRVMEGLDLAQHRARNCIPMPACIAIDASLGAARMALHSAMWGQAQALWQLLRIQSLAELLRLETPGLLHLAEALPLHSRRCVRCGMPLGYKENSKSDLDIHVEALPPKHGEVWVSAVGDSLERNSSWNYRMALRR